MKKNIIFFISIFITSALFAQNSQQARQILDKTYQAYESAKGIKVNFTYTIEEKNRVIDKQDGTAMIKGNKFKVSVPGVDTWFDGKTQWVFMKDLNEVNVSEPTVAETASISPLALLSLYKKDYNLLAPESKTINGKNAYAIRLTPISDKGDFSNIDVAIDKASQQLLQVVLTMRNGTRTKIDIQSYNSNYNFPDQDFTFNKNNHPGVEVVDLR